MFSMSLSAIIMCTCVLGVTNGAQRFGAEFQKVDKLVKSPGFKDLLDIEVRLIKRGVTLNQIIGSNISKWYVGQEDTKNISNVAFTALCCKYSESLYDFIDVVDAALTKCQQADNEHLGTDMFYTCSREVKKILGSHKATVLNILDTVLSYSRTFNVSIDKNFLNTLISVNLYLHADGVYNPRAVVPAKSQRSVAEIVDILRRTNIYVKKLLEAHTNESCTPLTYEKSETVTLMDTKCRESVNSDWLEMAKCLAINVRTFVFSKLKIVSRLDFKKLFYRFDQKSLMLTELLDVEIVKDNEFTKLKHLTVKWRQQNTNVQQVYMNVSTDYRSESLIKYQLLMVDCIASVVFYLITAIVEKMESKSCSPDDRQLANTRVLYALITLEDFNYPGPLNGVLQEMKYNIMYYSGAEDLVDSIDNYFQLSNFNLPMIRKMLCHNMCIRAVAVLDSFVEEISKRSPTIGAAMQMNEKLCDYEFEDVGFVQYAPTSELNEERPDNSNCLNCEFALRLKTQLLRSDLHVLHCKSLAETMSEPTSPVMPAVLVDCVKTAKSKIQEVEHYVRDTFQTTFQAVIKNSHDRFRVNRKLIDAFYSFMLYLNNDMFELPNLMQRGSPKAVVLDSLVELRRAHYLITNCLDQFAADHCSLQLSQTAQVEKLEDILRSYPVETNNAKHKTSRVDSEETVFPDMEDLRMGSIFATVTTPSYDDYSTTNELKTVRADESLPLLAPHDFTKTSVHWKYLSKFQSIMVNAVVCVVYENLINILDAINATNTTAITSLLRKVLTWSLDHLYEVKFPRHIHKNLYSIFDKFMNFIEIEIKTTKRQKKIDALFRMIKMEQSRLGIEILPSKNSGNEMSISPEETQSWDNEETVLTAGVSTKREKSSLEEFLENEFGDSLEVCDTEDVVYYSIKKLFYTYKDVDNVKDQLNDILSILNWRLVTDITMI